MNSRFWRSYKYEEEQKNALENLRLAVLRCLDVGLSAKQIAMIVVKILRKGKQNDKT